VRVPRVLKKSTRRLRAGGSPFPQHLQQSILKTTFYTYMGTGAAAPQTLRRGAHAFAITLLVILAWIPVGSDALSAKAAPKLAFAPPNQRLAQHVSRGLIRMASAAAAGVMCEVAGQATSPKPQLPTMQASLASDGAIATAVAPAQMLPVLSSMASAAAYRGTMALSYDSLLASMR